MFRRVWQSSMIALARSRALRATVQDSHATSGLARRFVAGDSAEAAVALAVELLAQFRIRSSLFYLGEYVDTAERVAENVAAKLKIAAQLGQAGLDVHVSVDPTQIGYSLDAEAARRHAFLIAEAVGRHSSGRPGVHVLMLDMEDPSVVDATIALHDAVHAAGLPAALTLQAYLRRTEADLRAQIKRGARVRLVKGAFVTSRAIAFTSRSEIKANSRHLIDLMFSRAARESGFYPIIATHDDQLQAYAQARARAEGWRATDYEFEMLLGVRQTLAENLAQRGVRVRLYLPFGRDWWPYAVRRIGENPRNARLLLRSMVTPPRGRVSVRAAGPQA
jgi:proline dehydrogenase